MTKIAIFILTIALFAGFAPDVSARQERIDLRENISNRVKQIRLNRSRAAIGTCILESKSGTTLTCSKDGKTYTIDAANAQVRRKFGGKSTLEEMTVGDTLSVVGKWTDEAKTAVQAKIVRDTSIQKRRGTFVGTVKSVTSDGWTMTTVGKREDQKVVVTGTTKYVNGKKEAITQADVLVGHRVYVKGVWNTDSNTIAEVTEVKDFSLPTKAN